MKSIYDTQAEHVAKLKEQLAIEEAKLKKLRYPIKTEVYVHGCDDSMYADGKELGLSEKQLENFFRTAYEVKFTVLVDEEGFAKATHVNDVELKEPVLI